MSPSLPILTFHSLDRSGSVISMPPDRFAAIMRELAEAGWHGESVSRAVEAWRTRGQAARTFGISFDDAYANLLTEALPVLADRGFRATVFVIAGRPGSDNQWAGQPATIPAMRLAGWADLGRLAEAGWEIGSHGVTHARLTTLSSGQVEDELARSRSLLEERLGVETPLFAYPYGAYDAGVLATSRRVYAGACAARLALAAEADIAARFTLPRVDAYYLRRLSAPMMIGTTRGRTYLALRRLARHLRH